MVSDTTTYVGRARWFQNHNLLAVPMRGRTQLYELQGLVREMQPSDIPYLRVVPFRFKGAPLLAEVRTPEDLSTLLVLVRPPCGMAAYSGV
jgi:hypothetical protein